ncbi:MAG TPA: hypothetical protein VF530_10135 [Planctomycetota bacterium]
MPDEKKPSEPEAPAQAPQKPETKAEAPKKAPYVFKIVPADPKNAFDFEDVADK